MKPSRAMIPGEILVSLQGLVLSYFGGVYPGWLNTVLISRHEDLWWLFLLGLPALLSLMVCAREMAQWRNFTLFQRENTAKWRGRAVLVQGLCFLYAVYFGFDHGAPLIGCIGFICFAYCVWAYLENRRTCREIRYSTVVAH